MVRRPGAGIALAAALVAAACSWSLALDGRLTAEDGATGVTCAVTALDTRVGAVDPCGAPRADGGVAAGPVVTGSAFRCRVSANVAATFVLQVRCPGYAPLDVPVPVESCAGRLFGGCDDIDVGALLVRR
jgi:hypothetical protein